MLKSKSFVKKTRKGTVVSVQREHYLRDDIACGFSGCAVCSSELSPLQEGDCILPDTNVVLHQVSLKVLKGSNSIA
jgi:exosome complex exonuclease DIS3/RRP44